MAVDEAILSSCIHEENSPTLRIYNWAKPAVSLGYFQRLDHTILDLDYCDEMGIDLVRRPTGGKAVLHGHDLTFSIAMREDLLPVDSRNIPGSHRWLMEAIAAGFRMIGISAQLGGDSERDVPHTNDCFMHTAPCDLCADGRKVLGAAQLRTHGALLQQCSIPCRLPAVDPGRVFRDPDGSIRSMSDLPGADLLSSAVIHGLQETLGVAFYAANFNIHEQSMTRELQQRKYSSKDWLHRRNTLRIG
jgi:lipoate-protein ligase A